MNALEQANIIFETIICNKVNGSWQVTAAVSRDEAYYGYGPTLELALETILTSWRTLRGI